MHAKPQFRVYMMHDLGALRRARPTAIAVPLVISFCLELSELRDEQEFTSTERDAKQLTQKSVEIDKELSEVYNEWKQINQFGFTKQRENCPMI